MIKVRVQRVGTQIAVMGGMAAVAAGAAGCAEPDTEEPATGEEIADSTAPFFGGEVTFDLVGWPSSGASIEFVISDSSTDEFLRVGQELTFDVPALTLWDWLYPASPTPTLAELQALQATISVTSVDKGQAFSKSDVSIASFSGTDVFSLRAITDTTVIPAKTDQVRFAMTITDVPNSTSIELDETHFVSQPVFGGELPDKSVLFDSTPAFRQRVIEGDDPVAGAAIVFGYTDYRADTLVDATTIDKQIGTQETTGRFGTVIVPVYGLLEHVVNLAVVFDDGQGWQAEAALAPNKSSRFLDAGRTAYEANVQIPAKSTRMELYIHVQTYLVANYPSGVNVTKWYADGEKVLKADKYDNPDGQPLVNYQLSIENK